MTSSDTVIRLNELVNTRRYDEMDELFASDYVDHNTSWRVANIDDLKRLMREAEAAFDLHNEIEEIVASGDWVFARVHSSGRHRGAFLGIPPTAIATSMMNFEVYRFADGKIKERWVESDLVGLLAQLGVKLPAYS